MGGVDSLEFRRDLYRGTADDYDRYRTPYPRALIDDLAERTGASGSGRLLDLACGTGQVSFALRDRFAEVWAVDQEPDMIAMVRRKAAAATAANMQARVARAEDLTAPEGYFDLVAMGNAFHRLPRQRVAASALGWLRPGGWLALLWSGTPWEGDAAWQGAVAATVRRWRELVPDQDRVPAGYERDRRDRPDSVILQAAGFESAGHREFPVEREWTAQELAGFAFSTAVLSRAVLGDGAAGFVADVQQALRQTGATAGRVRATITFECDLARRPSRRP